jgi:ELWxxDGT repeat protein
VSDGSAEGTYLLLDLRPGSPGSEPAFLTEIDGRLFFVADDGVHGFEPWLSAGTAETTRLALDILPGQGSSARPQAGPDRPPDPEPSVVQGKLFFAADDGVHGTELWVLEPDTSSLFRRGEVNGDGTFDLADPLATLGFLFLGSGKPVCLDAADANDSGTVDVSDAVYALGHLFLGGLPPPAPFAGCGEDGTLDGIECGAAAGC